MPYWRRYPAPAGSGFQPGLGRRRARLRLRRAESGPGGLPGPANNPAHAGNKAYTRHTSPSEAGHPRVCGEHALGEARGCLAAGPSPRVRGTRIRNAGGAGQNRAIPARAGNPYYPGPAALRSGRPNGTGTSPSSIRVAVAGCPAVNACRTATRMARAAYGAIPAVCSAIRAHQPHGRPTGVWPPHSPHAS